MLNTYTPTQATIHQVNENLRYISHHEVESGDKIRTEFDKAHHHQHKKPPAYQWSTSPVVFGILNVLGRVGTTAGVLTSFYFSKYLLFFLFLSFLYLTCFMYIFLPTFLLWGVADFVQFNPYSLFQFKMERGIAIMAEDFNSWFSNKTK